MTEKLPDMTDNQFLAWVAKAINANTWDWELRQSVAARVARISKRRSDRPHVTAIRLLTYTGPQEEVDDMLAHRLVQGVKEIPFKEVTIRETMMEKKFDEHMVVDLKAAGNKPRMTVKINGEKKK